MSSAAFTLSLAGLWRCRLGRDLPAPTAPWPDDADTALVHLPVCKLIASLRSARQAQTLASELAPILAWDEHGGAAVVERHVREQA